MTDSPVPITLTDDQLRATALLIVPTDLIEDDQDATRLVDALEARCTAIGIARPLILAVENPATDVQAAIDDPDTARDLIDHLRKRFDL